MKDLDAAITKLTKKTDVDIHLVGFKKYLDKITVDINLTFYGEEEIQEEWKIVCENNGTHRFEFEVVEEWEIFSDHELLWDYNKEYVSIYFNGKTNSTTDVIGELYKAHYNNTEGYIPFGEYINHLVYRIDKLLDGGIGLFAYGPLNLLDSYRNVLTKYGYKTNVYPLNYRNEKDYKKDTDYKLLVMGNSYVVAKNFSAHKVKGK
ncbi:hypothetical protein PH210_27615 [Paenibacillus sp. BSR1-1]|uniref:hypothetical protein n=1 Tax=Paenibacillus sp. BSR1-1 TaxID=3020845 RepID=UPI0025AF19ED|nr:hypothetical protein [Paenibacillus sp. BSR1-1]MDN3019915.1 hypothetical protein [Paenibacillus sp. BSR1-1]